MVAADEVKSTFDIYNKLREATRVCQVGSVAVPMTIVDAIDLARESAEMDRKYAKLFEQNKDMKAELVKTHAAEDKIRGQIGAAKSQVKAPRGQLSNDKTAFEKSTSDLSETKTNLCAPVVVVEKSIGVKKAGLQRSEGKGWAESEKWQQLFNEKQMKNETTRRQLAKVE